MSVTIHYSHGYAFLWGLYMGKLTNLPSDIIITGLVLYIVTPEIFTHNRWERMKKHTLNWFGHKFGISEVETPLKITNNTTNMITNNNEFQKPNISTKVELSENVTRSVPKLSLPKIEVISTPPQSQN